MTRDILHHATSRTGAPFALDALATMLSVSASPLAHDRSVALEVSVLPGTPPRLVGDAEACGVMLDALLSSAIATMTGGSLALRLSVHPAGTERVTLRAELVGRFGDALDDPGDSGSELARRLNPAPGGQPTIVALTMDALADGELADGERRAVLDLAAALPSRMTDNERLMSWAQSRGGRLLVVDDSATNRMVVAGLLAKAGFSVETANGGAEAVSAVARATVPHEAVLMDVAMPDMDGVTATATIRSLADDRARVPIIAVTANAQPEDRSRCLAAGMNDYLTKPVRRAELLGALERWLTP